MAKQPKSPKRVEAFSYNYLDMMIAEMVYDPSELETTFLVKDGSRPVEKKSELSGRDGNILVPISKQNELLVKGTILLPTGIEEYGSTQELLSEIQGFIHRYLDISLRFERIASFYVLLTWIYDKFDQLPYLRFLGDFDTGKSRALKTIGSLCYHAAFVGGATTVAPIFRIIDMAKGTLVFDEADFKLSDTTADIIKILNCGYERSSPVLRMEGERRLTIKTYNVFGPKIIGTRQTFQDLALESRCLVERMEKKDLRKDVPVNLPRIFKLEACTLRNKLLKWRFDNFHKIELKDEDLDRTLEPRLNQVSMPLLSIVDEPSFKQEIKDFIREYNDNLVTERGMSLEGEIFSVLLGLWEFKDKPSMKDICDVHGSNLDPKRKIEPRRMGNIVKNQLGFQIRRGTGGSHIVSKSENEQRILDLKRKFGIPVNEVNVDNELRSRVEDYLNPKELDPFRNQQ